MLAYMKKKQYFCSRLHWRNVRYPKSKSKKYAEY